MKNINDPVIVTFHGGAATVTGSKYLVETSSLKILVDCGLFQGEKQLRLRNWGDPTFPIDDLSAIVLTHAHIDHSGYLPLVVRRGFHGPIFGTPATLDLVKLLLPDSAHLQEEEARFAEKKGYSKHNPPLPLYSVKDAERTLKLLEPIDVHQANRIFPGAEVTPRWAGHILGSANLTLKVEGKTINFSGDVGRFDSPILPDPEPMELGDLLICESTYGDRLHAQTDPTAELAEVINDSAKRNGALLIPAFAIGRTQNLLFYIAKLERENRIPKLPVYVDSPMAVDATAIYRKHTREYDEETADLLNRGIPPMLTEHTTFCRSVDQSKATNHISGARIIIAASGMATGGRILHHLAHLLPKSETTVLIVGYQAVGTRGRLLQDGQKTIKMFGVTVPVKARVKTISGLSAHADQAELLTWLRSCKGTPKAVRIVHGEGGAAEAFSKKLGEEFNWSAKPANHLERFSIP